LAVEKDERARAEGDLRQIAQRLRDYAETGSDSFWETGPDHSFVQVDMSPQLAAGMVGRRRWDLAGDLADEPEKWRAHITDYDGHRPFRDFIYKLARPDAPAVYVRTSGKPFFDPTGRFLGYRGVASDVTAEVQGREAEKALRLAQIELAHVTRVTTLGELTASIVHEVNQPLAAIATNGEAGLRFLDRAVPDLYEVRDAMASMIGDSRRAGEVIQRIRALCRKAEPQKLLLDINDVIEEVILLIEREVTERCVSLRRELSIGIAPVLGDRVELQQVIINLALNGMQAMATVADRPRDLLVRSRQDGGHVVVAVCDAGTGIAPEHVERLFASFFTTKPDGMGMGLSICRSIIEAHGGRLWASQNAGAGATFQFTLPCVERQGQISKWRAGR
jgi:C4-dicarboxylate-specific signal transduction histidine kinase